MKMPPVLLVSLLFVGCGDNGAQVGGARMNTEEMLDRSIASGEKALQEGTSVEDEKVLAYLHEVLLNKEFGAGDGSIVRWIESPDIVLAEGAEASRVVFDRVIKQLNDALEGTSIQLESVAESRRARRIEVFMVPGSQFGAIGRARGFKVQGKQDGYVWVFWDTTKKFIQRATVMVAVDRIDGDLLLLQSSDRSPQDALAQVSLSYLCLDELAGSEPKHLGERRRYHVPYHPFLLLLRRAVGELEVRCIPKRLQVRLVSPIEHVLHREVAEVLGPCVMRSSCNHI